MREDLPHSACYCICNFLGVETAFEGLRSDHHLHKGASSGRGGRTSQVQTLQVVSKVGPELTVLQREFNGGSEIVQLISCIVPNTLELIRQDFSLGHQLDECVRQVDFAA